MTELPRTLIPYDRREALALKEAAHMAGRSEVHASKLVRESQHRTSGYGRTLASQQAGAIDVA